MKIIEFLDQYYHLSYFEYAMRIDINKESKSSKAYPLVQLIYKLVKYGETLNPQYNILKLHFRYEINNGDSIETIQLIDPYEILNIELPTISNITYYVNIFYEKEGINYEHELQVSR